MNDYKFTATGKKFTIFFLLLLLPLGLFGQEKIIFGLTGTVYKGDLKTFKKWSDYLEKKLNLKVEIKFSRTYAEMMSMIEDNKVDIAYVCNSTYVKLKKNNLASVLVMPVSDGKSYYYSYIISKKNRLYTNLDDFKGHIFAFTDPGSTSGAIATTYELAKEDKYPKTFFRQVVYTYAHAESIEAVLDGFSDGASVDSLVYEQFAKRFPKKIENLKIVQKLGPFTMSPIVAHNDMKKELFVKIQNALVDMDKDNDGKEIFKALSLDKLNLPSGETFKGIEDMMSSIE